MNNKLQQIKESIIYTIIETFLLVGCAVGTIMIVLEIHFKIKYTNWSSFMFFNFETTIISIYGITCLIIMILWWLRDNIKHKKHSIK